MINLLFTKIPLIIQDTNLVDGDMGMLWMILSGILVFFMQAGFTLVESGMTRSKNAVNIAMKNLLDI
jgi:Amt family ammonium transporter